MIKILKTLITTFTLFLSSIPFAETINCNAVEVYDGNTVACLTAEKQQIRIKLYGIDAPELDQPYGLKAKKELSKIFTMSDNFKKYVETRGYDEDNNILGNVFIDIHPHINLDVSVAMLELGFAWYTPSLNKDEWYKEVDDLYGRKQWQSRESKRGLWAQPTPVPPWIWRKMVIQKSKKDAEQILQNYRNQSP